MMCAKQEGAERRAEICDHVGDVIQTHEHQGDFKEW